MSNRKRHSDSKQHLMRHPAILIAATGLALGVSTTADAVTRSRMRLGIQGLSQFAGSQNSQGSSVVVANMDATQVWETHQAFGSRINPIWWPVNFPPINQDFVQFMPDGSNGELGMARGLFYSAHATAAASAMAGNWQTIPNAPITLNPRTVIGFAPGAKMILSAGFAGGVTPDGTFLGDDPMALAFTILALTDPKVAGFAANLLSIPDYEVATVVNASFGSTMNQSDRLGEALVAHAFDVAVLRNDPVIVAAVGDDNQNPALLAEIMLMGDPGGTVAAPASGYNILRIARLDQDGTTVDDNSGVGPLGVSNYPRSQGLILSSIDPTTFPMGCTPAFNGDNLNPGARSGPLLSAPGSALILAGSPAIDPPNISPAQADVAFGSLWGGTSFASAIAAGTAAMIHDVGNKNNLWSPDLNGVRKPSGLATRAIMMTAYRPDMAPNLMSDGGMEGSLEEDACIFTAGANDSDGLGIIDPRRIKDLLLANQARDVRSGQPMLVDGIVRTLEGFTRAGFNQAVPYDQQRYRSDPPTPPWTSEIGGGSGVTVEDIITQMAPIPAGGTQQGEVSGDAFGWFDGWRLEVAVPTVGTDMNTPFVTTVEFAQDPPSMVMAAPTSSPNTNSTNVFEDDDTEVSSPMHNPPSRHVPYGQPTVTPPPDPDLNNDRFDLGGGSMMPVPDPSPGPGNGTNIGGSSSFQKSKRGWDVGRLGVGFIDYPLGLITPDSTVRATLVWNRTEVWSETDIDSMAAPVGFKELQLAATRVRISQPPYYEAGGFPPPFVSEPGFELPNYQEAFALENLDLELWRVNPIGPNVLIAAGRNASDTFEHISVGMMGSCPPMDFSEILFARYFLRVQYTDTLGDMGGYRHCGDIQSLQLLRPGNLNDTATYRNLWPSEVPFGVAWFIDLANSPELSVLQAMSEPVDMDGNGYLEDADINLMIMRGMGDLNTDGMINSTDLSILLSKYGSSDAEYDLNQDGSVNGGDIATMLARFGQTPTP